MHLENGNQHARAGDDGVVERVGEAQLSRLIFVAQIKTTTLEVTETTRRVRFAKRSCWRAIAAEFAAARHPTLDVNHVFVLHAEVAGATLQQAIGKTE